MKARVKSSCAYSRVTACAGVEFVKYEWRVVPAGFESEVQRHSMLENSTEKVAETAVSEKVEETAVSPTPPKPKPRKRTKRKAMP